MEKKVFCLIGERCKVVKYFAQDGLSDLEQILRGLKGAAIKDNGLTKMLHNKLIVLQRPDPDRNNKLCDIDEDDEIENKSEVSVLLTQLAEPPICRISDLESGQSMSLDLNVLYEEKATKPTQLASEPTSLVDDPLLLTDTKCGKSESIVPVDAGVADAKDFTSSEMHFNAGGVDKTQLPELKTSVEGESEDSRNLPSLSHVKKFPMHSGPGSIPFPASLPPLTFDLIQKLKEFPILELQKDLIYFWGSHLWQATLGEPTKRDYYNLATSIVAAYPTLAGGKDKCSIVKIQLSTWIRNHRANRKKKLVKRDHHGKVKSPVECVAIGASKISQPTENDVQNALKELNKKHKDSDGPHVKRLLEITLKPRRTFIEKEAASMSEVIVKFPQLKEYEMLIFELLTLKKMSIKILLDNINLMIEKLKKFFSVHGSSQESEALVISNLCERLSKNKSKSMKVTQLFVIKEMMGSTENLVSEKNDSPRIVIYIAEEGVAAAFLVADENIRLKIPDPTVAKSVACLMAAYYSWDIAYPAAYSNLLEYIDSEVFGTSLKMKPIVLKFIRERNNALAIGSGK